MTHDSPPMTETMKLRLEITRLRAALREIAANGYLGVKGRGFCHPEGCESPGIAQKALRPAYQPKAEVTDE